MMFQEDSSSSSVKTFLGKTGNGEVEKLAQIAEVMELLEGHTKARNGYLNK